MSRELADLGIRIRERRMAAGLSQETVAELTEVSTNTIIRIEAGQMAMSIKTFIKIVKIFGVDAESLLGRESEAGKNRRCMEALCVIRHLRRSDQEVVVQTVEKLLEGLMKRQ